MITASIVLYHNSSTDVERLLNSAISSCIDKIYIIDHSKNDFFRDLEKISNKIKYIHNQNLGYGAGNNLAFRYAIDLDNARYHVVLNPDIYFSSGTIEELYDKMEDEIDIGMIMPKVLNVDGSVQLLPKLLPSPLNLLIRVFSPLQCLLESKNKQYTLSKFSEVEVNVPILSGCFSFFRVSALKEIGLYDDNFFMYFEDFDISRRMHLKYKTIYYPSVSIIHAHERGAAKSFRLFVVFVKSAIRYFNKYGWFFDFERRRINKCVLKSLK